MSPRHALLLATLVCATRPVTAAVPVDCEALVDSASQSARASGEATRRCFEALRADAPARRVDEPAAAEPARPVRRFAVLRELGELRVRRGFPGAAPLAAAAEPAPETCALQRSGSAAVPSAECRRCHRHRGHAVEVEYAFSASRAAWSLRTEEQVVRRGVLLPQGRVECVTCHDGRSRWKFKLALPPGAPALPAVVAGRPETYGNGRSWRTASASTAPVLEDGAQVSPAPLCAACHTHAD